MQVAHACSHRVRRASRSRGDLLPEGELTRNILLLLLPSSLANAHLLRIELAATSGACKSAHPTSTHIHTHTAGFRLCVRECASTILWSREPAGARARRVRAQIDFLVRARFLVKCRYESVRCSRRLLRTLSTLAHTDAAANSTRERTHSSTSIHKSFAALMLALAQLAHSTHNASFRSQIIRLFELHRRRRLCAYSIDAASATGGRAQLRPLSYKGLN